MNQNFEKCMEMLLVHEGGFVDGNKIGDPGGPFFSSRKTQQSDATIIFARARISSVRKES